MTAMEMLIDWGAECAGYAIVAAAQRGRTDIMLRLRARPIISPDDGWWGNISDRCIAQAVKSSRWSVIDLLITWGADPDTLLYEAAEKGDVKMMELASKPSATCDGDRDDEWIDVRPVEELNHVLAIAARHGRLDAMKIAKKWGAIDIDEALIEAALRGHLEAMQLLKDWGATSFNVALVAAAGNGQIKALKVLKDWGATDFTAGLRTAKLHAGTFKLLTAWGGIPDPELFQNAARVGKVCIMKILRKKGNFNYDLALYVAAGSCQVNSVEALVRWGATEVCQALGYIRPLEWVPEEEKTETRKIIQILEKRRDELHNKEVQCAWEQFIAWTDNKSLRMEQEEDL
jgi:hypothetical protein